MEQEQQQLLGEVGCKPRQKVGGRLDTKQSHSTSSNRAPALAAPAVVTDKVLLVTEVLDGVSYTEHEQRATDA